MADQKIENLLNVSMEVNDSERRKSPSLYTGFNEAQKTWEIIVRYQGNIEEILAKYEGITISPLLNNYAVIITPQQYVEDIANEVYIEFVEKPKRLFFQLEAGKSYSCINQVQQGAANPYKLFGKDVIVAVIDTGIDIGSRQFRMEDGTTRILNIWDQTTGEEWDKPQIDEILEKAQQSTAFPARDLTGHGTDVAHIACGSDGVASQADIIIVKMGFAAADSFPRTTQLMRGVDYVVRKAVEYGKPVAINISFGNNYGDHTGSSLLEQYINDAADNWKCAVCIGTGNEGLGATHSGGIVSDDKETTIEFVIAEYETSFNLQIWKNYWDEFQVEIIAPGERNLGRIDGYNEVNRKNVLGTTLLTYRGQPSPFSSRQEIYIDMIPQENGMFILPGVWKIRFIPVKIVEGRYDCWMPAAGALNIGTGFLKPDGELSITIPSTSFNSISVGAIDARTGIPAPFSGRGFVTDAGGYVMSKPDLTAPGVDVRLGMQRAVSGTSFATPFVTGSAALMMEWGIVRGNDSFLYGQKLKAYMIKGARQLTGMHSPNSVTGYGALCVADSLPG
ncbi:MAG: S8 family peptidase [Eubacteriales bacterium]|nr:S8 family peptidase [Eubacteriales bacterium]